MTRGGEKKYEFSFWGLLRNMGVLSLAYMYLILIFALYFFFRLLFFYKGRGLLFIALSLFFA